MEDAEIHLRIQQNDTSVFEALFKSLYAGLSGYACHFLSDMDLAEEITQDVFCNYWEKRQSISISTSIKSYLYTSVRNRCLNELRRTRHLKIEVSDVEETIGDSESPIETIELDQKIEDAVAALPEMSRKVFEMSRMEGLKYREIATQLEISVKAVEANMSRALRILRDELKDYIIALLFLFLG